MYRAILARHASMPRDPTTNAPWRFLGLRAPLSAFRVYGEDCYLYMRHIHEGALVGVSCACIGFAPLITNLLGTTLEHEEKIFYTKSSLFAGVQLSWTHVLSDCLITVLVAVYCVRWQRQLNVAEAVPGEVQNLAEVVEACSVVIFDYDVGPRVRDWKAGEADEELSELAAAAGAQPVAVSQAFESLALLSLRRQLKSLRLHRPWLVELERAHGVQQPAEGDAPANGRVPLRISSWRRFRIWLAGVLAGGMPRTVAECDQQIMTLERHRATVIAHPRLIPFIFLTFQDAADATRLVRVAQERTIWIRRSAARKSSEGSRWPGRMPLQLITSSAHLKHRTYSHPHLEVRHAPNPTDVRWEFLHTTWWVKRQRAWQARITLLPCLIGATAGICVAAYYQGALKAGPLFLDCVDDQPLAPSCDAAPMDRFFANFGNFLWTTVVTVGSVHLVLQPILILSSTRDAHQSHTALMLSLFLRFVIWQITLTVVLCLVLMPKDWDTGAYLESASWYDMGAVAIVAMHLGDVALINLFVEGLNINAVVQLIAAKLSSPTQASLNANVKVSNPSYLAFRYQHILKSWFVMLTFGSALPILLILHALMMLSSILVDRINLLARLQPVPSSDAVTARFAATLVLPFSILTHVSVGVGVYAAAEWESMHRQAESAHATNATSIELPGSSFEVLVTQPRPLTFLIVGVLIIALMLLELRRQGHIASKHGLHTPLQLAKLAWRVDYDGFRVASVGEAHHNQDGATVELPASAVTQGSVDFYAPGAWSLDPDIRVDEFEDATAGPAPEALSRRSERSSQRSSRSSITEQAVALLQKPNAKALMSAAPAPPASLPAAMQKMFSQGTTPHDFLGPSPFESIDNYRRRHLSLYSRVANSYALSKKWLVGAGNGGAQRTRAGGVKTWVV